MKKYLFISVFTLYAVSAWAQNVGINSSGAAAAASAMLDVAATDKGMLTPRMTAAQRAAIASPATGLLVYQTDAQTGFWYYDGTQWVYLATNNEYNNTFQDVGTGSITASTVGGFTALPGLSRTITLTGNAKVVISVDVGISNNNTSATGVNSYATADIVLTQNALFLTNGGYKRVTSMNSAAIAGPITNTAMTVSLTLTAGTYTFAVYGGKVSGGNSTISGDNTSVLQGMMVTRVIYQ